MGKFLSNLTEWGRRPDAKWGYEVSPEACCQFMDENYSCFFHRGGGLKIHIDEIPLYIGSEGELICGVSECDATYEDDGYYVTFGDLKLAVVNHYTTKHGKD